MTTEPASHRRLPRAVGLLGAVVALCGSTAAAAQTSPAPWLRRAEAHEVASTRAWQRVMHYRSDLAGGVESEVDGRAFFLSGRGKTSPRHELESSLRAFVEPQDAKAPDDHARCRFPARYAVLDDHLDWDGQLPALRCPALAAFLAKLRPEAVGLFYAGASVQHPASSVGHTFLSLGPRAGFATAISGKHAVEYTVEDASSNPVTYVVKGLSGGFDGVYRIVPLADKLREYGTEDSRDMWQYQLALSSSEVRRVALHLWELTHTTIDYYYLTENCSYHLLTLLEGAVPRLELTAKLANMVLPIDTIEALDDDLVVGVRMFPSDRRQRLEGIGPGSEVGDDHPARGHGPMRARFGAGMTSRGDRFATVGMRLAMHDLIDPPTGQADLVQVQLLDTVLRVDMVSAKPSFEAITFGEMMTLRPLSAFEQAPSWRVRAVGLRVHDEGCPSRDCFVHGLNGGIGGAVATSDRAVVLFGLAEAWTLFGTDLEGIRGAPVRLGLGPLLGLRLRLGDVAGMFGARWTILPGQHPGSTYGATSELRVPLSTDVALGLQSQVAPGAVDAVVWSLVYF